MSIQVKFFARLREEFGTSELMVDSTNINNIADVWHAATGRRDIPGNIFCALNHEHAEFAQAVKATDEVAFFPRITGG